MSCKFLVVAGRGGKPLPPEIVSALDRPSPEVLPFVAGHHVRWLSENGSVGVGAWAPDGPGRWWRDDDGFVAFSGTPRPRRGLWSGRRDRLDHLAAYAIDGPADAHRLLADPFALVRLHADGRGIVTNDAIGMHPLFVASTPSFELIGNRVDLVADALALVSGTPVRRSCEDLVWLPYNGYMLGTATGYAGVSLLAQGGALVGDGGEWRGVEAPAAFHDLVAAPLTDDDERVEVFSEEVADALRHAISISDEPPRLELTGGKDSRLNFAVALRAGLVPSLRLVTSGPAKLPDRQVAEMIAERFGTITTRSREAPLDLTLWEKYTRHVHRTSGLAGCWDSSAHGAHTTITGLGGEMLRSSNPRSIDTRTRVHALRRFERLPYGRAGLLRPEVAEAAKERSIELFLEPEEYVLEPQDLDSTFYYRQRQRRWLGSRADRFTHRVFPLYSLAGIRTAFEMGREDRFMESLHRAVIERASGDLAEIPFANDAWRSNAPRLARKLRGPAGGSQVSGAKSLTEYTKAAKADEHGPLVARILEADPANPALELLDRRAVTEAADSFASLGGQEKQQLLGAVTMLIWGAGLEESSAGDWPVGVA